MPTCAILTVQVRHGHLESHCEYEISGQTHIQTDLRITVEDGTLANAFPARFQQRIFFSMDAETGGEANSTAITAVATGT